MANNDSLVLNELPEAEDNLRPSIQIEQHLLKSRTLIKHCPLQKFLLRKLLHLAVHLPLRQKLCMLRQKIDFFVVCFLKV